MHIRKVDFANQPWIEDKPGLRFKERRMGSHKMRMLEVTDAYVDRHWCLLQHTGYVLEGSIIFAFPDMEITYKAGDGIVIMGNEEHRHKASVAKGDRAVLVLFEPN